MITVLADFLWMSDTTFLYYALILWFTLSIIDVFYNTDYINWITLLLLTVWATIQSSPSWEWGILIFLLYLAAFTALHIVVRNYMHKYLLPLLNKNAPKEFDETLAGKKADILGEGENCCARVDGVLYPVAEECRDQYKEGDIVFVKGLKNGLVIVSKEL